MWPLIIKILQYFYKLAIPTAALIAATIIISLPSIINFIPEDCIIIFAQSAEITYHVSIQFNSNHYCSGSLIGPKHVLTAAHCVDNPIADSLPNSKMKVVVGTHTLPGGEYLDVEKVFRHPFYEPMSKDDNIAVLQLKEAITESTYIKFINLPEEDQIVYDEQKLIVSGFGPPDVPRQPTLYLKKLTMQVVSNETCRKFFPYEASSENFCAVLSRGHAACQTEEGSPATVDDEYIIGVFSNFTRHGCVTGVPELFSYVPNYVGFIKNKMKITD